MFISLIAILIALQGTAFLRKEEMNKIEKTSRKIGFVRE